jgi:hypothetical protein
MQWNNPILVRVLLLAACFVCFSAVNAQNTSDTIPQPVFKKAKPVAYGKSQALYLEGLGLGFLYSANYDTRFKRTHAGFGYRLGVGAFSVTDTAGTFTAVTFPMQVNYLTGKGKFAFESGLGWTIVNIKNTYTNQNDLFDRFAVEGYTHLLNSAIGVRYHPINQGMVLRFTISPMLTLPKLVFVPWFGFSIGYGFHN